MVITRMEGKYFEIVSLLVGGGFVGALLNYFLGIRKQSLSDFTAIVQEYKDMQDRMEKRYLTLEAEVKLLRKSGEEKDRKIEELTREKEKMNIRILTLQKKIDRYEQNEE